MPQQLSLFEGMRLDLEGAIRLSLDSLNAYGPSYRHWAVAYSGGKDSSATVLLVAWAIKNGLVPVPDSLTILYADTRLELPPLYQTAMRLLDALRADGFDTRVVTAPIDDRFLVYMLGYGVPPPSNTFRWCTPQIKVEPMQRALADLRDDRGTKFLMLTGVRLGESAARDQRIAISCSKDGGECGQGWFQTGTPESVADTLAPLLHWRVCHVYDWIYEDYRHGYDVIDIADVYGQAEVRTGCVGCPLASEDTALKRLLWRDKWAYLKPLCYLKPLWRELKKPQWRKRKADAEILSDGITYGKNPQRMGPLTMSARAYGLDRVLDIQTRIWSRAEKEGRSEINLIDVEEERRIREMWAADMWPQKWSGDDIDACELVPALCRTENNQIVEQALLLSGTD